MLFLTPTRKFVEWLAALSDLRAVARITARLERLTAGHFGDVRDVGDGVAEMRINSGPGYRIYYVRRGAKIVVLLCGGDKSTQRRDIDAAKRMAQEIAHDQ